MSQTAEQTKKSKIPFNFQNLRRMSAVSVRPEV